MSKLYEKTDESFKEMFLKTFLKQYGAKADKTFLEKENIVNYVFLNSFCDCLDAYTKNLILEKYNYDVNLDMR